jgi:hypothetical protein
MPLNQSSNNNFSQLRPQEVTQSIKTTPNEANVISSNPLLLIVLTCKTIKKKKIQSISLSKLWRPDPLEGVISFLFSLIFL